MFDMDELNQMFPVLAQLGGDDGNSLLIYILLLGVGVTIGMLILLKLLFISMNRADQKTLDRFNETLDKGL